jgi:hypothetical protein
MGGLFDDIDDPIVKVKNKRVSKDCEKPLHRLKQFKKYIIIVFMLVLILPLLYLIPCETTVVEIDFDRINNDDITVHTYSSLTDSYSNLSIDTVYDNISYVESVELYFNSYETSHSSNEMMKAIAYGRAEQYGLNTLKYEIYKDNGDYVRLNHFNYDLYCYDFPTDYVLSYVKVRLCSVPLNNQNISFCIDYYGFFQDINHIQLKYQYVLRVDILDFDFSSSAYDIWYSYTVLEETDTIPSVYPYTLDLSVKRYNDLTEVLDIESV